MLYTCTRKSIEIFIFVGKAYIEYQTFANKYIQYTVKLMNLFFKKKAKMSLKCILFYLIRHKSDFLANRPYIYMCEIVSFIFQSTHTARKRYRASEGPRYLFLLQTTRE